jgi:cob(I)alamin adenosyltransferase
VIQFIKSGAWRAGEKNIACQLGVSWPEGGDGFSWDSSDVNQSADDAVATWRVAADAIASGDYHLVVLDEITYPLNWGWIDRDAVIDAITGRPSQVNIVATGRDAPEALIEIADTVIEMLKIRHAFDRGMPERNQLLTCLLRIAVAMSGGWSTDRPILDPPLCGLAGRLSRAAVCGTVDSVRPI